MEQKLKAQIGELIFQVIYLQDQLEQANAKLVKPKSDAK